ncbi:MAG TPA: universal stress protein [Streptomyces sp.]|jgi:Universal stress protein UspA and related nucleotide-binding proteins
MANSTTGQEVCVGVDPRDPSVPVLAWAAEEAERRGLPLRLVLSVPHDTQHVDTSPHHMALQAQGLQTLATAAETVLRITPQVRVETELVDGMPAAVLCQRAASGASIVVVGSRRLTRAGEILSAGSVTVPLSARADCPVVVVREPEHTADIPGHLIVGVDGSASSQAAVAFAVEEAGLRRASVHAVWVWQRPVITFGDEEAALAERDSVLAETIEGWTDRYPDVEVTREVRQGHPVEELARASATALAVVVGRRGRGGYTGMRLGSVVHGLLHRAECPVITVPATGD